MRWAVRAVLVLGIAASITGNVLHAQDNTISQTISAWPPLAFLITVELITRIPVHSRRLAAVRMGATALIAGIAAWVSYWHMAAVAARYGETESSPYLIPVSVDGLVVVASICLVELAGRISAAEEEVSNGRESGTGRAPGERGNDGDRGETDGEARGAGSRREAESGVGTAGIHPAPVGGGSAPQEVAAPAPAQIKPPRK